MQTLQRDHLDANAQPRPYWLWDWRSHSDFESNFLTCMTCTEGVGRVCMRATLLQLCLTLCDPMDYSLPGSSVCGILQARILEWVAMPSSSSGLIDIFNLISRDLLTYCKQFCEL